MSEHEPEPQIPSDFVKGTAYSMPSLCMKCYEQGETKFLMTEIPFYKEVILSSFRCDSCHWHDVQITNAAQLAPKTVTYKLSVDPIMCEYEDVQKDLSRTVVRTDSTIISIPELGFEIPANRSEINTVEGLLLNIRESLEYQQAQRKLQDPETYDKIQVVIEKFQAMQNGEENFTLIFYDPAGHCFMSNPFAPSADPRCTIEHGTRTRAELIKLGYDNEQADAIALTEEERSRQEYKDQLLTKAIADIRKREAKHERQFGSKVAKLGQSDEPTPEYKAGGTKSGLKVMSSKLLNKKDLTFDNLSDQAMQTTAVFPQTCIACRASSETRMCIIDIPYFGEAIVMCTSCQHCGFRDSEVKSSQAYGEKGLRISVTCNNPSDLSRDVLKSGDASIEIPELGLSLPYGVLGSRFSSIEGILSAVHEQIHSTKTNYTGDSEADSETNLRVVRFFRELEDIMAGDKPFTFVLDDPSGNSFIEGRADGKPDTSPFDDSSMKIEYYTRTKEQDDHLGITDMVVDNYYTDPNAPIGPELPPGSNVDDIDADSSSDDDQEDSEEEQKEADDEEESAQA